MTFDFLTRIRREIRITAAAAEETVLTLAERVNRKVQVLRLHWQASQIQASMTGMYRELGHQLTEGLPASGSSEMAADLPGHWRQIATGISSGLLRTSQQVRGLKAQLGQVEAKIVAMKSELIREDLLRFTRDLEVRGSTLQYVSVSRGARLAGQPFQDLLAMPHVRVVSVVRGPVVLGPESHDLFQPGDGVLLIGPPAALEDCVAALTAPLKPGRARAGDAVVG